MTIDKELLNKVTGALTPQQEADAKKTKPKASTKKPKAAPEPKPEGEISEVQDWRELGRRVLVSPASSYTMHFTTWTKALAIDGTAVPQRHDHPLTLQALSGQQDREIVGYMAHVPRARKYVEGKHVYMADDTLPQRIPMFGCQVQINRDLAEDFGFESLERMVETIEKQRFYGKYYAFIDDEAGLEQLKPKFLNFARQGEMNHEDSFAALENLAQYQVGPTLRELEPEND